MDLDEPVRPEGVSRDYALVCPRCQTGFAGIEILGWVVDQCKTCGILWFDRRELEAVALRPPAVQELLRLALPAASPYQAHGGCPSCVADTLTLGTWRGINLAMCSRCQGIAIDPAGLRAIHQAIRASRKAKSQFALESVVRDEEEEVTRLVVRELIGLMF